MAKPLAEAILRLHKEHMRVEDIEGFAWDLAILINEALEHGMDDDDMVNHVNEYIQELIDVNKED